MDNLTVETPTTNTTPLKQQNRLSTPKHDECFFRPDTSPHASPRKSRKSPRNSPRKSPRSPKPTETVSEMPSATEIALPPKVDADENSYPQRHVTQESTTPNKDARRTFDVAQPITPPSIKVEDMETTMTVESMETDAMNGTFDAGKTTPNTTLEAFEDAQDTLALSPTSTVFYSQNTSATSEGVVDESTPPALRFALDEEADCLTPLATAKSSSELQSVKPPTYTIDDLEGDLDKAAMASKVRENAHTTGTFTKSPITAAQMQSSQLGDSTINFDTMHTSTASDMLMRPPPASVGENEMTESGTARQSLYVPEDKSKTMTIDQRDVVAAEEQLTNQRDEAKTPTNEQSGTISPNRPPMVSSDTIVRPSKVARSRTRDMDTDSVSDLNVDALLKDEGNVTLTDASSSVEKPTSLTLDDVGKNVQASTSGNMDEVVNTLKNQWQAVLLSKEREWAAKLQKATRSDEKRIEEIRVLTRESTSLKATNDQLTNYASECRTALAKSCAEMVNARGGIGGGVCASGESMETLINERDRALEDIRSVENAFADLHRRFEKLRTTQDDSRQNQETLQKSVTIMEGKCQRFEERFAKLREHAEMKLEKANAEIDRLNKSRDQDTIGLRAQLKKRDLQVDTLEKSVEQKQKEISELTAICDELIKAQNSYGGSDSEA